MAMNWKQIETSREARLWIGQILVPLATVVFMASPETRAKAANFVSTGVQKVKNTVVDGCHKVKRMFKKEEEDPCKDCESYGLCPHLCKHFGSESWKQRYRREEL